MNIGIVLKYPSFWRVEQKGYLSLILIMGDTSNNSWSEENNVTYELSEWKFRCTQKLVCDGAAVCASSTAGTARVSLVLSGKCDIISVSLFP